jgi:AcrR family transcriptional regulator
MADNQHIAERDLRRCILDTARRLLVRDGYHNLSMRKIASAIQYSATSIYLYFRNKDALFHALIEEGMERLYEANCAAAAAYPDAPVERLRALCRTYLSFGLENPEYYEIMFMLQPEQMTRYPAEKYRLARRNLALVISTLEEGRRRGEMAVEAPAVTASALWALLHGAVSLLLARRLDAGTSIDVFLETVLDQALRSIAPAPVPACFLPPTR